MKKWIASICASLLCLGLCACGGPSQEEYDAALLNAQQLQTEMDGMRQELENQLNQYKMQLEQTQKKLQEQEALLGEYAWMISWMEEENYDAITNTLRTRQEEARKAELAARGVTEVTITLDNWMDYFEYAPYGYSYIKNSFNETTHVNVCGAIRLKEGYTLAEDAKTEVSFEFTTQRIKLECTANFDTLEISFGEVLSSRESVEPSRTTSFNNYSDGISSFGSFFQMNRKNGVEQSQTGEIEQLVQMLRVQGTLYLQN